MTPIVSHSQALMNPGSVDPTTPMARVVSIATATAAHRQSQQSIGEEFASLWGLTGEKLERWRRIIHASQIETRHAVVPIREVPKLTTAQRMRLYEQHAPPLAHAAARGALEQAGLCAKEVTDVIVVSCTGFSAPGVDVELARRLEMQPEVRRSVIGFMGCFGAITGLRAALGVCAVDPRAVALVVCVELCSLHLRSESDVQNQIASALFADGAGAVVVCGSAWPKSSKSSTNRSLDLRIVNLGASRLVSARRNDMSWRITDAGFAMTLSPRVPKAIEEHLGSFLESAKPTPNTIAVHPGGAAILDAAQRAIGLRHTNDLAAAREVMRTCGNMSSPSVLFVLDKLLERGAQPPVLLTAFGPGLTLESITLEHAD